MDLTPVAVHGPPAYDPMTVFDPDLKAAVDAVLNDFGVRDIEEYNTKIAERLTATGPRRECKTRVKGGKIVKDARNQWIQVSGPYETENEAKKDRKNANFGDNNGNWACNKGNKTNKHKNHGLHTIYVLFICYSLLFFNYFSKYLLHTIVILFFQAPSHGFTATRTRTALCC